MSSYRVRGWQMVLVMLLTGIGGRPLLAQDNNIRATLADTNGASVLEILDASGDPLMNINSLGEMWLLGPVHNAGAYHGDGSGLGNLNEEDPLWQAVAPLITQQATEGAEAFEWGNHATNGYLRLPDVESGFVQKTGDTMTGALKIDAGAGSNVVITSSGNIVRIGRDANATSGGVAIGREANGDSSGTAVGDRAVGVDGAAVGAQADGSYGAALGDHANGAFGAAVGSSANGDHGAALGPAANAYQWGAAVGYFAMASNSGCAMGYYANGSDSGTAIGSQANGQATGTAVGNGANGTYLGTAVGRGTDGHFYGVALGYLSTGTNSGVAIGRSSQGSDQGSAVGMMANARKYGVVVGYGANGYNYGSAIGFNTRGDSYGAALGRNANGAEAGAAVGRYATGTSGGVAMGEYANGNSAGIALGGFANGYSTGLAIGRRANAADSGVFANRIAIGHSVTNTVDNSIRVRGDLYLDGSDGNIYYRNTFGGPAAFSAKAFVIDHPLDPENKVLRHYTLEGPQVWNVYAGNARLVNGRALVQLPDYYSALNLADSEVYSLTPVGRALVWIEQKVSDGRFIIGGDADIEVSWTIKTQRNDPACIEDLERRPIEQFKHDLAPGQAAREAAAANTMAVTLR